MDRARFLRSTALRVLAGFAAGGLLADPAFAQSVESIRPTRADGRLLTYPVPSRDGAQIDAQNELIIARVKNDVYALSIVCPHRAVTTLEWLPDSGEFHCPKHNAHFQSDGELIDGRPDRAMDRYPVRHAGHTITVDTATVLQQDADHNGWARAVVIV